VTRRSRAAVIVPALALAITLTLSGCGRLGAQPGTGSVGSTEGSSPTTSASADDPAAIDGITQDLTSAGTANTEADSNATAGDQAGATGDEP